MKCATVQRQHLHAAEVIFSGVFVVTTGVTLSCRICRYLDTCWISLTLTYLSGKLLTQFEQHPSLTTLTCFLNSVSLPARKFLTQENKTKHKKNPQQMQTTNPLPPTKKKPWSKPTQNHIYFFHNLCMKGSAQLTDTTIKYISKVSLQPMDMWEKIGKGIFSHVLPWLKHSPFLV